jgi:hypothetical protein
MAIARELAGFLWAIQQRRSAMPMVLVPSAAS